MKLKVPIMAMAIHGFIKVFRRCNIVGFTGVFPGVPEESIAKIRLPQI